LLHASATAARWKYAFKIRKRNQEDNPMENKSKILSVLVSLTLLASLACVFPALGAKKINTPKPAGGQAAETTSAVQESGDQDNVTATFAEGQYVPIQVEIPVAGKINFSVDSPKTVQVQFLADGSDAMLELIDGAGLTWKLVVPGIALGQPQTLKMTALSGVNSSNLPGELIGGVLLEPDGLRFRVPATLTVSGKGLGEKVVLFTGAQDGSAMDFALRGNEVNSALVDHFSATAANNFQEKSLDDLGNWLDEQDKEAIAAAKKFLEEHKKDIKVPVPPSIPLECEDKDQQPANNANLDQFLKDAIEPENTLIMKLLSIKRGKAFLDKGYDESFSLELALAYRLEKKARLLMETYKGKDEKLFAVGMFALSIGRQIQLLGGEFDTQILTDIGQWCSDAVDRLIKEIIDKHDYRKVNAVWLVAKWAALLGNTNKSVGDILSKLEGALLFKFQGTFTYTTLDSQWVLKSEFPVRLDMGRSLYWMGSGSGSYAFTFLQEGNVTAETQPFTVNALINSFDVCTGIAKITVDRFSGDSETIYIEDMDPATQPYVKTAWDFAFRNYKGSGMSWFDSSGGTIDAYTFPVTLRNLDVNAVDDIINGETNCGDKCKVDFKIKLIHTPAGSK
jgi:hypothetical protein